MSYSHDKLRYRSDAPIEDGQMVDLECRNNECPHHDGVGCGHPCPDITLFDDNTFACWTDLESFLVNRKEEN